MATKKVENMTIDERKALYKHYMELDKFLEQVEPIVRESKNADEFFEKTSEIGRTNS